MKDNVGIDFIFFPFILCSYFLNNIYMKVESHYKRGESITCVTCFTTSTQKQNKITTNIYGRLHLSIGFVREYKCRWPFIPKYLFRYNSMLHQFVANFLVYIIEWCNTDTKWMHLMIKMMKKKNRNNNNNDLTNNNNSCPKRKAITAMMNLLLEQQQQYCHWQ